MSPITLATLREQFPFGLLNPRCVADEELSVLSTAFNIHFKVNKGGIMNWPYDADVVVRRNGVMSSLVVPIRICPTVVETYPDAVQSAVENDDFYQTARQLQCGGITSLSCFEVIFVKMLRPGTPNCLQWGIPGGVAEDLEGAVTTAERGVNEEADFRFTAKSLVLENQIYQSGNVIEYHNIFISIGTGNYELTVEAKNKGYREVKYIPLHQVIGWMDSLNKDDPRNPKCCYHDGKADHCLSRVIPELREMGFS